MKEQLRVEVDGGKYTVVQDHNGNLNALRHGQPWRSLVGDKLVLCLAYELDEARAALDKAKALLNEALAEIEPHYVDWALLNSASPDHDPNYKPKYPEIVQKIKDATKGS